MKKHILTALLSLSFAISTPILASENPTENDIKLMKDEGKRIKSQLPTSPDGGITTIFDYRVHSGGNISIYQKVNNLDLNKSSKEDIKGLQHSSRISILSLCNDQNIKVLLNKNFKFLYLISDKNKNIFYNIKLDKDVCLNENNKSSKFNLLREPSQESISAIEYEIKNTKFPIPIDNTQEIKGFKLTKDKKTLIYEFRELDFYLSSLNEEEKYVLRNVTEVDKAEICKVPDMNIFLDQGFGIKIKYFDSYNIPYRTVKLSKNFCWNLKNSKFGSRINEVELKEIQKIFDKKIATQFPMETLQFIVEKPVINDNAEMVSTLVLKKDFAEGWGKNEFDNYINENVINMDFCQKAIPLLSSGINYKAVYKVENTDFSWSKELKHTQCGVY